MKYKNGDIILIKGLKFQRECGYIVPDEHGSYEGRPCVIVGCSPVSYVVCACTSKTKAIGKKDYFYLGPNMIANNPCGKTYHSKPSFIYLKDFHELDTNQNYEYIYEIAEQSYLKLLQSIQFYFDNFYSYGLFEEQFKILCDINSQLNVLKRKYKIQ